MTIAIDEMVLKVARKLAADEADAHARYEAACLQARDVYRAERQAAMDASKDALRDARRAALGATRQGFKDIARQARAEARAQPILPLEAAENPTPVTAAPEVAKGKGKASK
jgi:hypothetical protein